jgi:anthranilate synthase component 1
MAKPSRSSTKRSAADLAAVKPQRDAFRRLAAKGVVIPVYREILADLETPVSAFLKLGQAPNSYLLESVEEANKWGRYSIIGLSPSIVLRTRGARATVERDGKKASARVEGDPLRLLQEILSERRLPKTDGLPRFSGGAVGFLAYEFVRFLERLPESAEDDLALPDSVFLISDVLLVFDNLAHTVKVIVLARPDGAAGANAAYDEAVARIEAIIRRLRAPAPVSPRRRRGAPGKPQYRSSLGRDDFMRRVARAKKYIHEGDAFQIVLSHRMRAKIDCAPFDVYRALRTINPSPYMYYFNFGDFQIAGSSPEVLVRESDGTVEVRPIAGTRPRGRSEEEEQRLEKELLADEKERAEHVMLVDLGRNDVGRVSRFGTVRTREFMSLERYSHVIHLVSHVVGDRKPGIGPFDVLRACFPAGTVTGAPKIRAMEIIEELEPVRRGVYAGAIGYFGFSGSMDMCISIRTVVMKGGEAFIGVGAGVVADSDPAREYEETMNKGSALFRAIEMAQAGID